MAGILKRAIDSTDQGVSEKRLIIIWIAIASLTVISAVIGLCFIVTLYPLPAGNSGLQAIKMLLYALILVLVFILVLSGVITWGDLNNTVGLVRGLAPAITSASQTVTEKIQETKTEVQGAINNG
jgi:beta-lactamase regulating signal transducer with metallopeptidase domain